MPPARMVTLQPELQHSPLGKRLGLPEAEGPSELWHWALPRSQPTQIHLQGLSRSRDLAQSTDLGA